MDKGHILREIHRTANENNGVPLGLNRFAAETGIKQHDWRGKHWAKWSDAIAEAGYTPNKMQGAYDENWLITQAVLFVREQGKFPTRAEFDLKSRGTPSFPNYDTIKRRFGKRSKVIDGVPAKRVVECIEAELGMI